MKNNRIIPLIILVLGQLTGFGQVGQFDKKLDPIQLKFIHNTHQYVVQADGNLIAVDTTEDSHLLIQNSYPKGGAYLNPKGESYGYGVFWTRIINESAFPIKIAINFPSDSFPIINRAIASLENLLDFSADSVDPFNPPNKYFKLYLPTDTMTLDKVSLFDYGASGINSFLDTCLYEPTSLEKTIQPQETYLFYIGIFMHVPDNGPVRTGIVAKDQQLFYSVSIGRQLDTVLIPCGQIIKKSTFDIH